MTVINIYNLFTLHIVLLYFKIMDTFPCIQCGKEVCACQQALECLNCRKWQHRTCNTGISQSYYCAASKGEPAEAIAKIGSALQIQSVVVDWISSVVKTTLLGLILSCD